jgi:hypothetical protein
MPNYLTGEADMNFPGPSIEQVVAQVNALYEDKKPVTTLAVFIRQRGDVVFFRDVCEHLDRHGSFVSHLLAQALLSGKVRNLGHQKGWIAVG